MGKVRKSNHYINRCRSKYEKGKQETKQAAKKEALGLLYSQIQAAQHHVGQPQQRQ